MFLDYMYVLPVCICAPHMGLVPGLEEGIGSLGIGVIGSVAHHVGAGTKWS